MESKLIKQTVARVLGMHAMKGEFEKRDVAGEISREADFALKKFSLRDEHDMLLDYIMKELTIQMRAPLPASFADRLRLGLPVEYAARVDKLQYCICVSDRGRNAKHVASWRAQPSDWRANAALKNHLSQQIAESRDFARDTAELLEEQGADSLEALCERN